MAKNNPYKTDVKNSKGHILGYITDGDTFPEGSVQDCLNMDFYKGQDERRPPYVVDIASSSIPLPTGYTIHNRIRKEFTDSTGASKFVHIIVATKQGSSPARTRIYMKGYFCSSAECENSYKASPDGFNDDWIELTEWWVDGQGITFTYGANTLISTNTELDKADNFFKGFWVINNVGEIIGIVTGSGTTGTGTRTTTITASLSDGATLEIGSGICRFQVNQRNVENWINITDVKLNGELSNIVKLYCGDKSRTLQLSFIKRREYFGGSYFPSTLIYTSPTNWNDLYHKDVGEEVIYSIYPSPLNPETQIRITYNKNEYIEAGQSVIFRNITALDYIGLNDYEAVVQYASDVLTYSWIDIIYPPASSSKETGEVAKTFLHNDYATVSGLYKGEEELTYYFKCSAKANFIVYFEWSKDDITYHDLGYALDSEIIAGKDFDIELGLIITIKESTGSSNFRANDKVQIPIIKNPLSIFREGFEFDYDISDILNRKNYTLVNNKNDGNYVNVTMEDIGEELGITFSAKGFIGDMMGGGDFHEMTNYDRAYSLAIELDGYQTIFVRQILSNDKRLLKIKATLQKWFNRRITACLLFYDEWSYSVNPQIVIDGVIPLTYLCDKTIPGYYPIVKFNVRVVSNAYEFDIVTDVKLIYDGTKSIPNIKYAATGISLNAYLNQEYWKSILCYAKQCIKVNKSLIAFKLSQANVDEDVEKSQNVIPKVGKNSICVGEYQQAFLDANSIMSSERQYEATLEEILNGCATEPGQFLLFTSQKCYWYELTDVLNVSTGIKHIGTFLNKGIVAEKGMVAAIFTDKAARGTADEKFSAQQFSGVFWAGFDSIYAFFNNEPVDLLIEKWKEEYQLIPIEVKETVQTGYNPVTKDIWFHFVFSTGAVQYVFNLENKHWKKYNIQEEINNLEFNEEGLITWHDDTDLFKLLSRWDVSGVFMDTNDTGIEMLIKEINNHGTKLVTKIPDMFYMTYECENTENSGEGVTTLNNAKFNLKVSSNDNSNDIYDKDFSNLITKNGTTTQDFKKEILYRIRQRCNYYAVELSMSESESENVKKLKIFDFSSQAKLTGHQLTRV